MVARKTTAKTAVGRRVVKPVEAIMAPSDESVPLFTLRGVYLRGSHISFENDFDPLLQGIQLTGTHRIANQMCTLRVANIEAEGAQPSSIRSALFVTKFEFRYLDGAKVFESATDGSLATVSAEFAADYLLNRPEDPTQDEMNAWGASNVLLHTWPYWREFCHATLLKMSLPGAVMPMLVLEPASGNGQRVATAIPVQE